MRAIVQRVHGARVEVDGRVIGQVDRGVCIFIGAGKDDCDDDLRYVADKIVHLRIFPDDEGKMSRSLLDIGGQVLAISQFTVYGDVRKGRRPSFSSAMHPTEARTAYERFIEMLRERSVEVATGQFAAAMRVVVDNDGPVSILIDSKKVF